MESLLTVSQSGNSVNTAEIEILRHKLAMVYPGLGLNDPVWNNIVHEAAVMTIPAETVLMQPDSLCLQFMLLIEGSIRIYQQTPNDREVTLYRIYGGELCVLSMNGLMKQNKFDAFARTESNITALTLSRSQFMKAMAAYEPFRESVLTNLSSRFHDVLELIEQTVFESLDTRLICLFARLAKKQNNNSIELTHQEIARELGSSREVISRLLKGLERQGCIKLGRGTINLLI